MINLLDLMDLSVFPEFTLLRDLPEVRRRDYQMTCSEGSFIAHEFVKQRLTEKGAKDFPERGYYCRVRSGSGWDLSYWLSPLGDHRYLLTLTNLEEPQSERIQRESKECERDHPHLFDEVM